MIFAIMFYLPLENGPSFEQAWIPLPRDAMCQVWLKLAKWFWRRNRKCEKFTKGLTDKGRTTSELKRFTSQKTAYKKKTENKTGE